MLTREVPEKFPVALSFCGVEREFIRTIADAVEKRLGLASVFFDEWFEYYLSGHDADIKLQHIYGVGCELAVVCVSGAYETKAWALAEHEAIRARLMQARATQDPLQRDRIFLIRVGDGEVEGIPFNAIIPDVRGRTPDEVAELITQRLKHVRTVPPASSSPRTPSGSTTRCQINSSWPTDPPMFTNRLADRATEWPAVIRLLTTTAQRRILVLRGPSNFGKSALLNEAKRYARECLNVPVVYLDFKDPMLLAEQNLLCELKARDCGSLTSFANAPRTDRWALLHAFRQLSNAFLLVLDTYENVAATRDLSDWLETQLLPEVEDNAQLRILIAGQRGPDLSRARWGDRVEDLELDRIHSTAIWAEWIREHNPAIETKHVESIVLALEGIPGSIRTALLALARNLPRTA